MATLIPVGFIDDTDSPIVWRCSECDAAFSLDRVTSQPSITQLHRINANFRAHCRNEHPSSTINGLSVPTVDEDASQSAARIVREATEGK